MALIIHCTSRARFKIFAMQMLAIDRIPPSMRAYQPHARDAIKLRTNDHEFEILHTPCARVRFMAVERVLHASRKVICFVDLRWPS
jgi:hypothetical protein